jgi:hypothetical protein
VAGLNIPTEAWAQQRSTERVRKTFGPILSYPRYGNAVSSPGRVPVRSYRRCTRPSSCASRSRRSMRSPPSSGCTCATEGGTVLWGADPELRIRSSEVARARAAGCAQLIRGRSHPAR